MRIWWPGRMQLLPFRLLSLQEQGGTFFMMAYLFFPPRSRLPPLLPPVLQPPLPPFLPPPLPPLLPGLPRGILTAMTYQV
mmetsp:Transcript_64550/g.107263  ORF Transcript_64550/g.107263 Transcript_64550/m.107263 type:complete len:80 (-) Transcript_64550:102-341(-)